VLQKMMAPHNRPIAELSKEEGISEATLYNWRNEVRSRGVLLPNGDCGPEGWSSAGKFAAVVEKASLHEAELAAYCRRKGLYPEQVQAWRSACEQANDWRREQARQLKDVVRSERRRVVELERELTRKDKALAEAAALLVPRKKAQAILGGEARTHDQRPRSPSSREADRRGLSSWGAL
jgi:transposase